MAKKLLLLLFTLYGLHLAYTSCIDTCVNGTCKTIDQIEYCSCHSGYTGENCTIRASDTCDWGTATAFENIYYPTFSTEESNFYNNILSLGILSPLVTNRLDTEISTGTTPNGSCKYPGAYWSKSIKNCSDMFLGEAPWSQIANCGWNVTNNEEWQIFKTFVSVKQRDDLGNFRGTPIERVTTYHLPIQIRFKTSVALSFDIQTFSTVNALAALTRQEYIPSNSSGVFEITTSLPWPYVYNLPFIITLPPGFVGTFSDVSDYESSCTEGEPCLQRWRLDLSIAPETCSFTGTYVSLFNLTCHPQFTGECPIEGLTAEDIVTITVISEDFCTTVSIDIDLVGTIKAYRDSGFTEETSSFFLNNPAYFKAELSTNGKANLLSTTIKDVYVTNNATTNFILVSGQTTSTNASFTTYNFDSSSTGFSFMISQKTTPVPVDQSRPYTVHVKIEVSYVDNVGVVRSRMVKMAQRIPGKQATYASKAIQIIYRPTELIYQLNLNRSAIGIAGYAFMVVVYVIIFFGQKGIEALKKRKKLKAKRRLFTFIVFSVIFSILRGIGEVIRLTYSATNEISIVPALEIYCAIIGIGLYVLLTLFVDLWLDAWKQFLPAKAVPTVLIICTVLTIFQSIILIGNGVLYVTLQNDLAQFVSAIINCGAIGITTIVMTGVIMYCCLKIIYLINKSNKASGNTQDSQKRQSLVKLFTGVFGIIMSYVFYLIYLIFIATKVANVAGGWIFIAQNIHEWVLLTVFAIILFPYDNIREWLSNLVGKKTAVQRDVQNSEFAFPAKTPRTPRRDIEFTDEELKEIERMVMEQSLKEAQQQKASETDSSVNENNETKEPIKETKSNGSESIDTSTTDSNQNAETVGIEETTNPSPAHLQVENK